MNKLLAAATLTSKLKPSATSTSDVKAVRENAYAALNDDLNTAIAISHLFEGVRIINSVYAGTEQLTADDIAHLAETMNLFAYQILGLKDEVTASGDELEGVMQLLLSLRADAKSKKDFATSDKIRDTLKALNIQVKDGKEGTTWNLN